MACIALPPITIPDISPLSFTPPIPDIPEIPGLPNLCCKLPPIPIQIPPIPIPTLVLSTTIMETLQEAVDQMLAYINSLPLDCPLE